MTKKFVAFDIETANKAPESASDSYRLGITCIGVATSDGETLTWPGEPVDSSAYTGQMTPGEVIDFAAYLLGKEQDGYSIVSWNGMGFDFRVLAEEVDCLEWYDNIREMALRSIDPAFQMLCEKGYMVGLGTAAEGMGLQGKTEGMNGLKAVDMWAGGRDEQEKVLEYVLQDAKVTADVYGAIVHYNKLRWTSRSGRLNAWYPTFNNLGINRSMLTVTESMAIPVPDTSWMSKPIKREKFVGWAIEPSMEKAQEVLPQNTTLCDGEEQLRLF